jgi:hypothetical protein
MPKQMKVYCLHSVGDFIHVYTVNCVSVLSVYSFSKIIQVYCVSVLQF